MDEDILGMTGYWKRRTKETFGYAVSIPIHIIGFGRGRVKVRITTAEGREITRFVHRSEIRVSRRPGKRSTRVKCRHSGCPVHYINRTIMDKHEAVTHMQCKCGRFFTSTSMIYHKRHCKFKNVP